jgi:hypothetical protein
MASPRGLRRRRAESAPTVEPVPASTLEPPAPAAVGGPDETPQPAVDSVADDPAELAEAARHAAVEAREGAARAVAEAQAEAQRILAEAQAQAADLERAARAADAEAEAQQAVADRDAAIVRTEAELATLTSARDRLGAEAAGLEAEIGRLESRISELSAAQAEARQRRVMAVRGDDAAGLREALTDLGTAGELAEARQAELAAAQQRLAAARAEHEEVCTQLGRASLRLLALRRQEAGLPPVDEVVAVSLALLPALVVSMMQGEPERLAAILMAAVPEAQRPAMAEALRLGPLNPHRAVSLASTVAGAVLGPQIVGALQQLALDDPAQYRAIKRVALDEPASAPLTADERYRAIEEDGAAMVTAALAAGGAR